MKKRSNGHSKHDYKKYHCKQRARLGFEKNLSFGRGVAMCFVQQSQGQRGSATPRRGSFDKV